MGCERLLQTTQDGSVGAGRDEQQVLESGTKAGNRGSRQSSWTLGWHLPIFPCTFH